MGGSTFKGSAINRYDGDEAVITLVRHPFQLGLPTVQQTLEWENGDWKVKARDNGEPFTEIDSVSSMSSLVLWTGRLR